MWAGIARARRERVFEMSRRVEELEERACHDIEGAKAAINKGRPSVRLFCPGSLFTKKTKVYRQI